MIFRGASLMLVILSAAGVIEYILGITTAIVLLASFFIPTK